MASDIPPVWQVLPFGSEHAIPQGPVLGHLPLNDVSFSKLLLTQGSNSLRSPGGAHIYSSDPSLELQTPVSTAHSTSPGVDPVYLPHKPASWFLTV